ncbi:uncharacterized protein N7496_005744, partial [Penicillium cataractarum]
SDKRIYLYPKRINKEIVNTLNKLFFKFTTTLSKSKDITIYLIFSIYNNLFSYLKASEEILFNRRSPKGIIITSLIAILLKFPILIALTRDILSIPTSSTSVERLFNYARDIYHYRRRQLKPEIVKALILYIYTTKFKVKQREINFTKQLISVRELALLKQERGSLLPLPSLDPISDSKEAEDKDTVTKIPS